MLLHKNEDLFNGLVIQTAAFKNIPQDAVIKDYMICSILQKLSESEYINKCIFKGGTSLSKCYEGVIERFSEDIDLTYLSDENESTKSIERNLKNIEKLLAEGFEIEKIEAERSNRNKSAYLSKNILGSQCRIKLEIGSSVRPEPYNLLFVKTYFQEFLESIDKSEAKAAIAEYGLKDFEVNVLDIVRTFIDKIFAVKRHVLEGSINNKARHLYDIVCLYNREEIVSFVAEKDGFKKLIQLVKATDKEYLNGKRSCEYYHPQEKFNYALWVNKLNDKELRKRYERLHEELLYTNEKQNFDDVLNVMEQIGHAFEAVGE